MSAGGGTRAIVAAFLANLGIAITKFVAFLLTGATSLLAEAVHSVADTGNQGLLLLGGRRAARRPDDQHPFGYGRERYFWAFVVALVLFSVGGLFAVYEGVEKVLHPKALDNPVIGFAVLGISIVLESFSLRTAVHESRPAKKPGESWPRFIRRTRAPELPVVLLEDVGALTGLVLALLGLALAEITGNARFDGLGSIAIGLLLVAISAVLARETKSLLIGESAEPELVDAAREALAGADRIRSVIHLRTLQLGPDDLLVAAKVEPDPSLSVAELAGVIDAAEVRLRSAVPSARLVFVEPDVRQPAG